MTSSAASPPPPDPSEASRPGIPALDDQSWSTLYRIGGFAAECYVLMVLVALVLLAVVPVPPADGPSVLAYIADHRLAYLTELVCFVGLSVPALAVFLAVAVALRTVNAGVAAVGGLLGVVSETVALAIGSSPQSLHGGLVVLSDSYVEAGAAADPQGRRAALAAAADALIASTNAITWAGILTAAAILLLSSAVLSSVVGRRVFGRSAGLLGVIAGSLGIVSEALRPVIGPAYLLYGLLLPSWFGLVGWKLLRLRPESMP